jgi:predicted deacylase
LSFEVLPRDLTPYRKGNIGVDYVHRFESGRPGPHVLINALTHGNEFCGMVAACDLLDTEVRPMLGTLTISFSNVEAYESFDIAEPFKSRLLVHNFNRIWSDAWLDGPQDSPELRRARSMRGVVAAADAVLDIHSTSQDVDPFFVYQNHPRNAQMALSVGDMAGCPRIHMVMPGGGFQSGDLLIQHGKLARADWTGASMVVECGQHFRQSSADVAKATARAFLALHGMVERGPAASSVLPAQRRVELLSTHVVKTTEFRFARPVVGFEEFAAGELILTDGAQELRAPCDRCTVLMPTRQAKVGAEGVYLTRPID